MTRSLQPQRAWNHGIAGAAVVLTLTLAVAAPGDDPGGYTRPYGPDAPWNIPIRRLREAMGTTLVHPDSVSLSSSLWSDAPAHHAGNFNLSFDSYTYPVYCTADATGEYPVDTTWSTNIDGTLLPWNPNWQPATGSDAQVILIDPPTGREWNLWQVSFDGQTIHATNGNLVMETIRTSQTDPYGNPIYEVTDAVADYHSYEGGFVPSRGVGIQYLAMLVRPEEIAQGAIRHAFSMPIQNTDGTLFVAPATKLEHPGNPPGIPEGMRFALDVTDAEIETWIAGLPGELPAETVTSARIIARAMRDYGWFITDSSGGADLQFEWRGVAANEWAALGLGLYTIEWQEYPRDLLDGLITENNIYAIVPSDAYPAPGDCNADGAVDLADFQTLTACLAGPAITPASGCWCHDLDDDADVDLADFAAFQRAFEG
ncbi:MAG: hypothetical protein JXQ75_23105 [Phycisphaerae bacterium]|nr:hypothetical protein [Phycisphaerae bacterium]